METYGLPLPTELESKELAEVMEAYKNYKGEDESEKYKIDLAVFTKFNEMMEKYYEPIWREKNKREIEQFADIRDIIKFDVKDIKDFTFDTKKNLVCHEVDLKELYNKEDQYES